MPCKRTEPLITDWRCCSSHNLSRVIFPSSRDPSGDLAVAKTWSERAHFHHTLYFFQREGQWPERRQGGKGGQDWQSVVLPQKLEIDIKNWQVKNDP